MDWQLVVQVLGVIGGIVIAVVQLRTRLPKSRSTLKHDLEVLQLMDPSDPLYPLVKNEIDNKVRDIYEPSWRSGRKTGIQWGGVITSGVVLTGFALWAAYSLKDGFSWISIPTAFVALLAFFALIGFVTPEDGGQNEPRNASNGDKAQNNTAS